MPRTDQLRTYDRSNLAAARLIAADPKYAALMREWALLFLQRYDEAQRQFEDAA